LFFPLFSSYPFLHFIITKDITLVSTSNFLLFSLSIYGSNPCYRKRFQKIIEKECTCKLQRIVKTGSMALSEKAMGPGSKLTSFETNVFAMESNTNTIPCVCYGLGTTKVDCTAHAFLLGMFSFSHQFIKTAKQNFKNTHTNFFYPYIRIEFK